MPVTGIVREQKAESFYTKVVGGVSSLVEMVSDRLVSVVFYVSQVFLETGVRVRPCFVDRIDSTQFKIADLTGAGDMLLKIAMPHDFF